MYQWMTSLIDRYSDDLGCLGAGVDGGAGEGEAGGTVREEGGGVRGICVFVGRRGGWGASTGCLTPT